MQVCRLIFLLLLLSPLTQAADLPFVFGEETPPLEGVPKVSEVPEDELME